MAVVQLTDQLANEVGEIVAMIHKGDERGVLVPHRFPVDSVHVRRIEEVAHVAPGFVIDLGPFRVAIELHVESTEFQLVILGFELVLRQIDDGVILLDLDQHLLAVSGDLVAVDIAKDRFFAVFQVINAKVLFAVVSVAVTAVVIGLIVAYGSAKIEDTIVYQTKVVVITRRYLKNGKPVPYPIQVYLDSNWLLGVLIFVFVLGVASLLIVRLLLVGFLVAVLLIALFLISILVLLLSDFITAWA